MKVRQIVVEGDWIAPEKWEPLVELSPQLVLVFASVAHFESPGFFATAVAALPQAQWVGCSTAGEISASGVADNTAVITAIRFDQPRFHVASTPLEQMDDSFAAGRRLAESLQVAELSNVLVFGQGVDINGSALISGLQSGLPGAPILSGGLAGDGGRFAGSYTLGPAGISHRHVVAVGFQGSSIRVTHGSFGGWQPFGPARKITRHQGNVLYELDDEPALAVYKRYLGDHVRDLPASGLLFPFSMMSQGREAVGITRTILGVDQEAGSLILAGDLVEGGYLQLMHASTDALVDGAQMAAEMAKAHQDPAGGDRLALLVSCVGRKLVMGGRVDEEVEAVGEVFGGNTLLTGFYSNGEISPHGGFQDCQLHNQTMTITCLSEP